MLAVHHTRLIAIITLSGCTNICPFGPQCEDSRPAARLSVLSGEVLTEQPDAWGDANPLVLGGETHGAAWVATSAEGQLVMGLPETDLVVVPTLGEDTVELPDNNGFAIGGTDFGASISTGYIDGDQAWDLLAGGPAWGLSRGAAYLFFDAELGQGTLKGAQAADLIIEGSSHADQLGQLVRVCGDLTGDGRSDIIMTAPWFTQTDDAPFSDRDVPDLAGAVFVGTSENILAMASGSRVQPWDLGPTWWGMARGDGLGHDVICDRDLNGDGLADVLMSSPWSGEDDTGSAWLILGGELPADGPIDGATAHRLDGEETNGWAGMALALLDLNGDGTLDPVLGMPGTSDGMGQAAAWDGSKWLQGNHEVIASFLPEGDATSAMHFGRWMATGDVDGDGLDDLLISAPDRIAGRNYDAGAVWGWLGSDVLLGDVIADDAPIVIIGNQPFQRVGRQLHLDDLDGDGRDDLVLLTRSAERG
jgi:hypothetical protein